jgi:hydroxycarboxylate dehydrogenase B
MANDAVNIGPERLERFVGAIFCAAGCDVDEAGRIAHYLVRANLAGHDSHGVVRVPRYLAMLKEGLIFAGRTPEVTVDTPALCVVDGKFGFGQTVAPFAVEQGIERCVHAGLSAVALRNAGHVGRVADWAEMAADRGLVSVHFVNAAGSVLVAPYGSAERRFSTAPFAVGIPLPGRPPLLLDFATSVVAEGKVMVASLGGKAVPADALIDRDGRIGNDPHMLYGDYGDDGKRNIKGGTGAIRAFGGHKGSGLALVCELLGGALTGNGCASNERRFANGMFSVYVDPARVDPAGFFPEEALRYADHVRGAVPARAGDETLLPGDPERRTAAERIAEGVPLPQDTWRALEAAGRSVGVAIA